MCGIAGIWGQANEELVRKMTDAIAHRGPDDSGVAVFSAGRMPVSLGHRRLSIIDLSPAGHQPMSNEDGSIWIVYNGEIYNFPELREQLLRAGHKFRSRTDTEVLLHGYEEWGLEVIPRLNGIFAFALWDARQEVLHLARDRYGVKPLYLWEKNGRILFSSEIKALLCEPEVAREVNPEALLAYAKFRYCPEPLTLLKGIRKVMPAEVLSCSREKVRSWRFYEVEFPGSDASVPGARDVDALALELRRILEEATRRQMIADVPVGLFLSGGVDSGALLAFASKINREPLNTFTIGFRREDQHFEGQPDDVGFARQLAHQFRTNHREIVLEPKIVELLPKVVWHLDDPIGDPAAITSFLICQAAREQGTKVLLSGQGGDEVFAGYPWHLAMQLARYYNRMPSLGRRLLESTIHKFPAAKGGSMTATLRRLRKFSTSASLAYEARLLGFLSYAYTDNLLGLLSPAYAEAIASGVPERAHQQLLRESGSLDDINRMLYLDIGTFLPSLNLMYTDKTSMAFGVEVRVPLIDNEVLDFMGRVPPALKIHRLTRKYLMKRALAGLLPDRILHRKKAGFGAPIRTWIVSDLRDMIGDLLSEDSVKRRGFFNPAYVQKLIGENAAGRHDYNYLIYVLLTFELWARVYLDGGNN